MKKQNKFKTAKRISRERFKDLNLVTKAHVLKKKKEKYQQKELQELLTLEEEDFDV